MKTTGTFITATAAICLLASCAKDEPVAPNTVVPSAASSATQSPASVYDTRDLPCLDADAPLLGRAWKLRTLSGRRISLADGAIRPSLAFVPGPDHGITGFGGCNEFSATVAVGCESIAFLNLGSTHIYCEGTRGLEQLFLNALHEADSYRSSGGSLVLFSGADEIAELIDGNAPLPRPSSTL